MFSSNWSETKRLQTDIPTDRHVQSNMPSLIQRWGIKRKQSKCSALPCHVWVPILLNLLSFSWNKLFVSVWILSILKIKEIGFIIYLFIILHKTQKHVLAIDFTCWILSKYHVCSLVYIWYVPRLKLYLWSMMYDTRNMYVILVLPFFAVSEIFSNVSQLCCWTFSACNKKMHGA